MILYLIIILLGVNLTAIFNAINPAIGWGTAYLYAFLAFLAILALDAVVAIVVRWCPEKKINPFAPIFICGNREKKFYKFLRVRVWKDYIPESGKYLCNFAKDEIADPTNNTYILKFLRETCYASIMHIISLFLGFVLVFVLPMPISITLPIISVNAFLQFLPICVQRFNRPRLVALYKRNQKLYGDNDGKKVCQVANGN